MNFLDARLPERFWNKCIPEPNSGCWLWIASTDRAGVGQISWAGRNQRQAHHVAFITMHGALDPGSWIKHTCEQRCCVNPAHLVATRESRKNGKPVIDPRRGKSRRRRMRPRSVTLSPKHITRAMLARGRVEIDLAGPPVDEQRPRVRGDCEGIGRPCPYVGCKHHMFLDVNPHTGSITFNFPDLEPEDLEASCVLDLADNGGLTLEETGIRMNVSRERIRQVEVKALVKARAAGLEFAA